MKHKSEDEQERVPRKSEGMDLNKPFLTTAEAARYCGFKTAGGLRKAKHDGHVHPAGRRFGTKTLIWRKDDLDRYLLGLPPAAGDGVEQVIADAVKEGCDERSEVGEALEKLGGTDRAARSVAEEGRRTSGSGQGHRPDHQDQARDPQGAAPHGQSQRLQVASGRDQTRKGGRRAKPAGTEDAIRRLRGLLARKKGGQGGKDQSAKTRERWVYTLTHLIEGTDDVPGLGGYFIEEIRLRHLAKWRDGLAVLVEENRYKATTINGWFAILRVIFKAATWELQLPQNPMLGVENFDTSTHATYTVEEPNTLSPQEAEFSWR